MPTLDIRVAAGGDDGWWTVGNSFFAAGTTAAYLGGWNNATATSSNGFARFTGVTIPPGSTIDVAYITYTAFENGSATTVNITIRAVAADNASAPTNFSQANGATRTSASTAWNSVSSWVANNTYNSPSIVSVIQEVVNRGGWASGNAIVIHSLNNGSTTSTNTIRRFSTYENNTATAPLLHIEYTPPNTAPEITVAPSVTYNGKTRLGPQNSPATVSFTAIDAEETSADELSYTIRTAASGGGTLVGSGTCTSGVSKQHNIAHNATGLAGNGSQTLYLQVSDGEDTDEESFTLLQDNAAPAVGTITYDPDPVLTTYSATFTLTDSASTGSGELSWQIRTESGGAGTELLTGTATTAVEVTTASISDTGLVDGSNTRYLYVLDGANNVLDQSFTVTAALNNPLPVLLSLSPNTKSASSGGFTLTATGTDFAPASVIRWNGTSLTTTFVSDTEIRADISGASIEFEGTVSVTVFSPTPGGGQSDALTFTITEAVFSEFPVSEPEGGHPLITLTHIGTITVDLPCRRRWSLPSVGQVGEATFTIPHDSPAADPAYVCEDAGSLVSIAPVGDCGRWNGIVTKITSDEYGTHVTASQPSIILSRIPVALNLSFRYLPAYMIVLETFRRIVAASGTYPLAVGAVAPGLPLVDEYTMHGESCWSVLLQMMSVTGQELRIDTSGDRDVLTWGGASDPVYDGVLLAPGQFRNATHDVDISQQASRVTVLRDYEWRTVTSGDIAAENRWPAHVVIKTDVADLRDIAETEIERLSRPNITITGSVPQQHWSLREGHYLRVAIPWARFSGTTALTRIISREIDERGDLMTLELQTIGEESKSLPRETGNQMLRDLRRLQREQERGRSYLGST